MKECTIIGYGKYTEKEEKKEMLRVIIGIDSISEKYKGIMVAPVHLEYNEKLERNLDMAIKTGEIVNYTTTDNIISGKTKVSSLIFKEN